MPTINDLPPEFVHHAIALLYLLVLGAVILGFIFKWRRKTRRKDQR